MISQDPIEHIFGNITLYFITVIFEAEACLEFETRKENFYFYSSAEVKLTLRYLSLHSADVDPRMICMNPDLYWSIIIHYGSITKALKVAGGQRLYDIGFGGHDVDFQIQHSSRASLQLSSSLISNHFVSKFTNKDMELRYCCSKPGCFKFEDTKRFLVCGGCSKETKRRYCSEDCYEKDWEEHQKYCQQQKEEDKNQEEEVNNNETKENQGAGAWKQAQQKKKMRKGKGKKKF